MIERAYDVFLSYNSEDREAVETIAVHLADRAGLRPWLDRWELTPGEPWLGHLERGLASSRTFAVFVGCSGEGPWKRKEVAAALDRQAKSSEFRVIPVLLPGAPEPSSLPAFLIGNTWVEFRAVPDDEALWKLECGIRGVAPGRGRPEEVEARRSSQVEPRSRVDPSRLIQPGGAMDVDSRFYIRRAADDDVFHGLDRSRGLVTVRGPRQSGKTSLILKAYVNARRPVDRMRPVFVDLQAWPEERFDSLDAIWRALSREMNDQLGLEGWDPDAPDAWSRKADCYDRNVSRFLDRFVFREIDSPVLLCLDEVDRIFSSRIQSAFFASVRAFWNRGAFDPTWKRVKWLLSTSSEPAFFIEDLSQSPFNIGLRVELNAFTAKETADFALRHGLSLSSAMIDRIMESLGGRPYLVHLLLYHMALDPGSWERLLDVRSAGGGIFIGHLKRYLARFQREPELAEAMKRVIDGQGCENVKMADRLEAAGLVRRDASQKVVCLCGLYADYFGREL